MALKRSMVSIQCMRWWRHHWLIYSRIRLTMFPGTTVGTTNANDGRNNLRKTAKAQQVLQLRSQLDQKRPLQRRENNTTISGFESQGRPFLIFQELFWRTLCLETQSQKIPSSFCTVWVGFRALNYR
jgi:hypothetical protein